MQVVVTKPFPQSTSRKAPSQRDPRGGAIRFPLATATAGMAATRRARTTAVAGETAHLFLLALSTPHNYLQTPKRPSERASDRASERETAHQRSLYADVVVNVLLNDVGCWSELLVQRSCVVHARNEPHPDRLRVPLWHHVRWQVQITNAESERARMYAREIVRARKREKRGGGGEHAHVCERNRESARACVCARASEREKERERPCRHLMFTNVYAQC